MSDKPRVHLDYVEPGERVPERRILDYTLRWGSYFQWTKKFASDALAVEAVRAYFENKIPHDAQLIRSELVELPKRS